MRSTNPFSVKKKDKQKQTKYRDPVMLVAGIYYEKL